MKLKELRRQNGLTQAALAAKCLTHQNIISCLETVPGFRGYTEVKQRVAEYLGYSYEELFGEQEPRNAETNNARNY